jgi:hypothetical protein
MLTFEAMAGVERNWHITVPGFGSEEYRAYKQLVRFLSQEFVFKSFISGVDLRIQVWWVGGSYLMHCCPRFFHLIVKQYGQYIKATL